MSEKGEQDQVAYNHSGVKLPSVHGVVFQRLKSRYPEAYSAFGAERKRETFEKHERSHYIELQRRTFPHNPDNEGYLEALKRLRHHMIMVGLGYGDRIRPMAFTTLRNSYPEAFEAFKKESER